MAKYRDIKLNETIPSSAIINDLEESDESVYSSNKIMSLIPDISVKADKSNVLELNNTTEFTPNNDYEPATKKYVDDNAGGSGLTQQQIEGLI